jgi:hypothetical protein
MVRLIPPLLLSALAVAGFAFPQDPDEAIAQAIFEEAAAREKASADKPDVAMTSYHELCVRHPLTKAGRAAAQKCVALEGDVAKALDREFGVARTAAEKLLKEGRFADALQSLRAYSDGTNKEALKRRSAALAESIENDARRAYVVAVKAARAAATKGAFDESAALLKSASEKSTEDVKSAAEGDLSLLERYRETEERKKAIAEEEASRKAFGDRAAKLLKRARERAYADVVKELDAAIADPALASAKDRLAADRAVVVAASTFWDAVLKTLKARVGQDVRLKKADGKYARGTLKRVADTGVSLRLEPPGVDIPLETLHADTLVALAIHGDGLPADAGASYAAAAMWFFLEGRPEVSRIELATAVELKADVSQLEPAWRSGFFRIALGK